MTTVDKRTFITDSKGKKKAVIVDLKIYEQMLEDIEDLRIIAERKNEETSSLEDVEKRLKVRGLL